MDPDPNPANFIGLIIFAIALLLITVILSIGEEAYLSLGDTHLRELEQGDNRKKAARAARVRKLTENERAFQNRVRLGNTVNSLIISGCVLLTFTLPLANAVRSALLALVILVVVTILVVDGIGTRLPRHLIAEKPEKALSLVGVFSFFFALLRPLDILCNIPIYPILRLCGINPSDDTETVTEDDIRDLMDAGEELGSIEGTQKDMVNNIFEFDDITASEIMTPRTDVIAIEADTPIEDAVRQGVENGYSRLPVYEEDVDHIIGILYIKDLLKYVGKSVPKKVTVRSLLRDTRVVPETKKCDDLFEEMNEKHLQMAVVVDEHGGVAGIVTIEDLLESIVGNMQDEFDDEEEEITQVDNNSFVIDGSLNVGDLEELIGLTLPEGDYDTVAGFVMDQLGHIPQADENAVVEYENVTLTIQSMDDKRIETILVNIQPLTEADEGSDTTEE